MTKLSGLAPVHVSKRTSEEKTISQVKSSSPNGNSRVESRARVTASRISIRSRDANLQETAMNMLHGDHATVTISPGNLTAAILGSREDDNPCKILVKGRACGPYNPCKIDIRGDNGRAEW